MRYTMTRTTTRQHEAGTDRPAHFEAVVHLQGSVAEEVVTLADVQQVLTRLVQQGVPATATMGASLTLPFAWDEAP